MVNKVEFAARYDTTPVPAVVSVGGQVFQNTGNPAVGNIVAISSQWGSTASAKSTVNGAFGARLAVSGNPVGQWVRCQCEAADEKRLVV